MVKTYIHTKCISLFNASFFPIFPDCFAGSHYEIAGRDDLDCDKCRWWGQSKLQGRRRHVDQRPHQPGRIWGNESTGWTQ